jgi:tetratricopeptide (TPR) repeat protein
MHFSRTSGEPLAQNVPYFSLKLGAAYYNLGAALCNSGHYMKAAQRYLQAKERYPVGSGDWAEVTAKAFEMPKLEECAEVVKPEWWNDEELKALSARVLRAAPNDVSANIMRAMVLRGGLGAWEAGPRSAAELKEAAKHYERSAALSDAPAAKAEYAGIADRYRSEAEAM